MVHQSNAHPDCGTCRANRGELASPGGVIYDNGLWRLEHVLEPVPFAGWLVLKPLRHIESLSELSPEESSTLGPLIQRVSAALHAELAPAKVYMASFGEGEGFAHIHFHFIPRMPDTPHDHRGPWIFSSLRAANQRGPDETLSREAERVARAIRNRLASPTTTG